MSMTDLDRPATAVEGRSRLLGALTLAGERLSAALEPLRVRGRTLASLFARGSGAAAPYEQVQQLVHRRLLQSGFVGFLGTLLITLGASQPNSPFTEKIPGAWFFGIPGACDISAAAPPCNAPVPPPGSGLFFGVVAVYGGMILLMRAWYDIVRVVSRHRGVPLRRLALVFCAWALPLLVVAPLFSRDLYSYAAQGEMMSHHLNPYLYGPADLGSSPILTYLPDGLWGHVTSPYGPVFLALAGWIVEIARHDPLASVVGMRLLALVGTLLFAVAIPSIARSFGRDGATAFTLAALNPLILLHLIGGGHNDALMIGLLAVGYALARRGQFFLGIVCCALGAVVKVPAIVGVIYIGWEWIGPGHSPRERVRPTASALLIAGGVMAAVSVLAGLGWGWISGLSNPDQIRSWLDPATALGLAGGKIAGLVGLGGLAHPFLTLTRGGAMLLAVGVALRLLLGSEAIGPLRAIGWTLVAFAALGPVVQPWYLTWGFVFLAPVVVGATRHVLCVFSAAACFLGLPGGFVLVDELGVANPLLVSIASLALVGLVAVLVVPRLRRLRRLAAAPAELELAASVPLHE